MSKADYCFLMLTVIASPGMGNSFRSLLGTLWFIAGVLNFIVEVH